MGRFVEWLLNAVFVAAASWFWIWAFASIFGQVEGEAAFWLVTAAIAFAVLTVAALELLEPLIGRLLILVAAGVTLAALHLAGLIGGACARVYALGKRSAE